jgi:uncharacterized membrane protein YkvA (DUF1232 family)
METQFIRKFLPYILIALGFVYGIFPLDLIPDIPVVGWVDDIGVMGTTIMIAVILLLRNQEKRKKIEE